MLQRKSLTLSYKHSLEKTTKSFWCFFVFVTLFNLQGTHRTLAALIKDTTSFFLCQELFSNFFKPIRNSLIRRIHFCSSRRPFGQLIKDTTLASACQELFSELFKSFCSLLCRNYDVFPAFVVQPKWPPAKRLIILPEQVAFVNTFFQLFCFSRSVPLFLPFGRSAPKNQPEYTRLPET